MFEGLVRSGFTESRDDRADLFIINTCTVTHKADKDVRNSVGYFNRKNPNAKIIIAGCYAELEKDRNNLIKMPGVVRLVRNSEKRNIAEILEEASSGFGRNETEKKDDRKGISYFKDHDRAFIKIQDGCNNRCSYCKVRIVRGPSKSRHEDEIRREAERILLKGFKEIVLTGVCLGSWGMDLKKRDTLAGLLKNLTSAKGNYRVRLSSIEPMHVTDELISIVQKNEKMCRHLHIPLQSGDNEILRRMRRPYTKEKFRKLITKIRRYLPDIAITTDVLVGFPGEDDKSFERTAQFITLLRPSRIHVFPYSAREGTEAKKRYPQTIEARVLKNRVNEIKVIAGRLQAEFGKGFIGKEARVLVESARNKITGQLTGYTDEYVRVRFDGEDTLKGELISVVVRHLDNDLII